MAAITDLASASSVAAGDYLVVSQSGTDKKATANKFAIVAVANTFTTTQSINPATNATALGGTMPVANTSEVVDFYYSTQQRFIVRQRSNVSEIRLVPFDNGSAGGPHLFIGRNSNASTPSPGYIIFQRQEGTSDYVYQDASANLRLLAGVEPNNANINNGTIIGTQSSSLDVKNVTGDAPDAATVLAYIAQAARAVRQFKYKNGSMGGQEFSGIVIDYAPRYGMDRDKDHPDGKSLNIINAIGDLMIVAADLAARVAALEAHQAS